MSNTVWSRFKVRRSDGSSMNLRIQDLPESRSHDAVELYVKYFIVEETFHKAAGVAQNPRAVEESRRIMTNSMKDPSLIHTICCEDTDDGTIGQIIGVDSMALSSIGPDPFEGIKFETKEVQMMFKLMEVTSYLYDAMKGLNISQFYDDRGMIVHPEFRKLGIATEFLRARRFACISHNVAATAAVMSSLATQKSAEKDNWETVQEIQLDDLGRQHGVSFEKGGIGKLMIWKNPQFTDSYCK